MSKPPKIDRKELNKPDQFVEQGRHVLELFVGYQTKILSAIVGILVILLGGYGYQWRKTSRNEQGWKVYFEVNKTAEPERWEKLKKVSSDYSSLMVGQFAATQIADHYFDEAKKQSEKDAGVIAPSANLATEWYSKALSSSALIAPNERGLLLINRAGSYEMAQNWDAAMADYTESAKIGFEGKALALLGQARVYELKKENTKAIETYEKVSADFLNSEYGKLAKNYLRRLKSPLFMEPKS